MMPEEKILKDIIEKENRISMMFKLKALEALKIDNIFDLKDYVKKHNINIDIDITDDIELAKEKVYYLLNEEFYKLREEYMF